MSEDPKSSVPAPVRRARALTGIFAALLLLPAACTSTPKPPPPRPQGLVAVRRIELGSELFVPGDDRFVRGALDLIDERLADVPTGARLRVEVFGEGRDHSPHSPRGGAERLSRRRAEAMRKYLREQKFEVVMSVGRGMAEVDGRVADQRVDVYVLK